MPTNNNSNKPNSLFISLVSLSLLLTFITVVLSAYIRLSVNGLGCSEWPDCYGRVNMTEQHQGVDVLTAKGGAMKHSGARVAHRLIASVLGVFIVIMAMIAIRQRRQATNPGLSIPLLILAITVFLSWLGYVTPSPLLPAVTLGNLLGGLAMLSLLWWLGQRTVEDKTTNTRTLTKYMRPWVVFGLILLSIQIILGSWTSAWFAGPVCPELPGCSGVQWSTQGLDIFSTLNVDSQGKVINAGTAEMIHLIHRFGAMITAAYLLWLGIKIISRKDRLFNTALTLLTLLGLQIGVGLISVMAQLPLLMVTTHNAIAALLLLTTINLLHLLTPQPLHRNY